MKELLELARAGEISEETLESTEKYSHLLSETGMSAKRVKDNIGILEFFKSHAISALDGVGNL